MEPGTIILLVLAFFIIIAIFRTARIVPNQEAFVVERLGKYARTLAAGFHILIPFIEKVAYKHTFVYFIDSRYYRKTYWSCSN